jgi:mono/diheme cytochrome c family protein
MGPRRRFAAPLLLLPLLVSAPRAAESAGAAQRGRWALLGRAFNPAAWSAEAYANVWHTWGNGTRRAPEPYDRAVRERYGLHPAPYPNGPYPMGLREATGVFGSKGVTSDCLLCHGGSVLGQSYVGLGNASLDIQALFEDLARADGRRPRLPFTFCNVRGTSEAATMAVFLLGLRTPDLRFRKPVNFGLKDDMCEDVPAWWLLKKKKTMYYTGTSSARSVRSLMQFMLASLNTPQTFAKEEATFRDIQAYLLSLEPPKYPFPIDRTLAHRGEQVFARHCAKCHGTYGADWTYPNRIVPIDVIGTDRKRFEGLSRSYGAHYNRSWFAHEQPGWLADDYPAAVPTGYQAPPLDGIWATAPYFHNGSAPTVYHVLNSKARPKYYTRSFRTGREDYDPVRLGWKIRVLQRGADARLPAVERRKVYDTTLPGRGNGGHTFGDRLSEAECWAVIEYLKTL